MPTTPTVAPATGAGHTWPGDWPPAQPEPMVSATQRLIEIAAALLLIAALCSGAILYGTIATLLLNR